MLFHTLELKTEEAESLKRVLVIRKLLNNTSAYALLCQDLEFFENNTAARQALEAKTSFAKVLGMFLPPAFETGEDALGMYYVQPQAPKKEQELSFGVGAGLNWKFNSLSGISFFVTQNGTNKVLFQEGPFPNKGRHLYPYNQKRLILKMANFFYNKRPLYEKIHKSLLENKPELTALTNQEFTEDLTSLFSVKSAPTDLPTFLITEAVLKTRKLETFWKKEPSTRLGSTTGYLKETTDGYTNFYKLKVEVSLSSDKELSFATAEAYNYNTPRVEETYPEMRAMLLANTNAFLQQLVASANFAAEIYEKIKTKILLENI